MRLKKKDHGGLFWNLLLCGDGKLGIDWGFYLSVFIVLQLWTGYAARDFLHMQKVFCRVFFGMQEKFRLYGNLGGVFGGSGE